MKLNIRRTKKSYGSKKRLIKRSLVHSWNYFGHLQSASGEAAVQFTGSLSSAQFGTDRVDFLNNLTAKMSETTELPTIREIEGLLV